MIDLLLLATGWMVAGLGIAWIIGGASRSEELALLRGGSHGRVLLRGGNYVRTDSSASLPTSAARERRLGDWRVFVTMRSPLGSKAPVMPRGNSRSSGRG
jgi:hypothetical protein